MQKPKPKEEATLSLYEPDKLVSFAGHLQKFFAENNLVAQVQGRPHVRVPGWQYAGTKLGIVPMVEEVLDQSHRGNGTDKEIRYQTRVALLNIKTNQYVGCGIAVCSNQEPGKRNKPAYAIQSQSQSRAIGKAYRNLLGWVVELAGFDGEAEAEEEPVTPAKAAPVDTAEVATEEPKADDKKASVAKRRELLIALNHECISQQERDRMFLGIDKMTAERCAQALEKVRAKINAYDNDNH